MNKKEEEIVLKAFKKYASDVARKIPFGLLLGHGYSIDDRKEFREFEKVIKNLTKQNNPKRR